MIEFPLENWLPYRMVKADGDIRCNWLNTFGKPFDEPFFDETISKCFSFNRQFKGIASVSDLFMIEEWSQALPEVHPAAIIFHVSRCGSTLVSQLLALATENIVLSEVPFFDDILRLKFQNPEFDHSIINNLFTSTLKFYAQQKHSHKGNKQIFIKADSWHLFFYEQLRQLYPTVPFILLYRRPDEVFRSHKKLRGMQAVPGLIEPELFGFNKNELIHDQDRYLAAVLERYLIRSIEIEKKDHNFLLLNYNEGPMPIIEKLASFVNLSFNTATLLTMAERSRYHSKKPDEPFHEKTEYDVPALLDKAMKLYDELEAQRLITHTSLK